MVATRRDGLSPDCREGDRRKQWLNNRRHAGLFDRAGGRSDFEFAAFSIVDYRGRAAWRRMRWGRLELGADSAPHATSRLLGSSEPGCGDAAPAPREGNLVLHVQ